MSVNTKIKTNKERAVELAQHAGLFLMTAAATIGMFELPDHPNGRVALLQAPALTPAYANAQHEFNPIRREREESGPHYISYSTAQRTPGRSSRI